MAFPAVNSLRRHLGLGKIAVAAPASIAPVWKLCPFVDEIIALERPKKLLPTARQLKAGGFASALLLPNSLRVALEARLAKIPIILGYAGNGRNWALKKPVPRPTFDPARIHHKHYYLRLVDALGIDPDESLPTLRPGNASRRQNRVAFFPGAEYGPAKRWPALYYAQLAQRLKDELCAQIVLYGGKKDMDAARAIATEAPWVENRAGQTTLEQIIAEILSCRLVVCNDSGAMHLASVLDVPTVAIFGSTEPKRTAPLGSRTEILRHHVSCSPCFLRACPIDFGCMLDLKPETAWRACEKLWNSTS